MVYCKISPCEAARQLKKMNVPYGQDYTFPYEIETGGCEPFGGLRCDCNLHVTGENRAHRDRVDPRRDLLGHIDQDVGIPKGLVILGLILGGVALLNRLASTQQRAPGYYFKI